MTVPLLVLFFTISTLFVASTALPGPQLPWSWDNAQLCADFFVRGSSDPLLTSNETKFFGENYRIVSLEKCLGAGAETKEQFYSIAKSIRDHSSSNTSDTKILYYRNSLVCLCSCYTTTTNTKN